MKAIFKLLAVIYLVCIVFRTKSHPTFLYYEEKANQQKLAWDKKLRKQKELNSKKYKYDKRFKKYKLNLT